MKDPELYVRLRKDVYTSAQYMIAEQGAAIAGVPGVTISVTTYINDLAINDLAKRGHYPPRVEEKKV